MKMPTTIPIPESAFASVIQGHARITDQITGTKWNHNVSTTETASEDVVQAALKKRPSRSPLILVREMAAAAAFAAVLQGNPRLASSSAAEDFMATLSDNAISRPMLGFSDVNPARVSPYDRGVSSMRPMELSRDDALAITKALTNKSARPAISMVSLPQFEG